MDVSFKAVVLDGAGRVLLGTNARAEWELLGGRADPVDADPHGTIARELAEEAGVEVEIGRLIDIWYYDVPTGGRVAVASYLARIGDGAELHASHEHTELRFFAPDEIDDLTMPAGYKTTIQAAVQDLPAFGDSPSPNE